MSRVDKYRAYKESQTDGGVDVLRWPVVGRLLRARYARPLLQLPLLLVGLAMIAHGFLGPDLAPKNLATVLVWVHYRGLLVLALLLGGNFFCMACPFMLPRQLARKVIRPRWNWPRALRNKWLSLGLFASVLFCYELFSLWSSPWWTAALAVAFFAGAVLVDSLFKHATFCKHVCPIGQFNFLASTLSPLEVRVRDHDVCSSCTTHDCIKGRRSLEFPERIVQPGCELALFLPTKVGNLDCTFCMDCARACPHDNVALASRLPGAELVADPRRSGIGRLSKRPDLAAFGVVFMFGALVNAFGMVSPVYAFKSWLSQRLGLHSEVSQLGFIFFVGLVLEPLVLLTLAAQATRLLTGNGKPLLQTVVRYAYSIVPLGFAMWLSHYSFHFLTGLWTFIPVTQNALWKLGWPVLGMPQWQLGGLPQAQVHVVEMSFLGLGVLGSLGVGYRIAREESPSRAVLAFAPWALLTLILWLSALWLLAQPMEMRATMFAS